MSRCHLCWQLRLAARTLLIYYSRLLLFVADLFQPVNRLASLQPNAGNRASTWTAFVPIFPALGDIFQRSSTNVRLHDYLSVLPLGALIQRCGWRHFRFSLRQSAPQPSDTSRRLEA